MIEFVVLVYVFFHHGILIKQCFCWYTRYLARPCSVLAWDLCRTAGRGRHFRRPTEPLGPLRLVPGPAAVRSRLVPPGGVAGGCS